MPPPFVVFALPRSRTAWLAQWLGSVAGAPVAHDLAIESDTIDAWLEVLFRGVRGTVETGAVEGWPILRRAIPDCRIAVVLRPLAQVVASLKAMGLPVPLADLERRAAALEEVAREPGALVLQYNALADPRACAVLQEHCLGLPFDWLTWLAFERRNVQLDLPARMARLAVRHDAIERLRAELVERLAAPAPFVSVGEERWGDVADAMLAMSEGHFAEATEGLDGGFNPDRAALAAIDAAGLWRCFLARVDGALAGYCTWVRDVSIESDMPPTMVHGPFYVAPEHRAHRLGLRLLDVSRRTFEREGIAVLRLHHTMHGRGVRAGRLYQRLGAVEYQREYLWRIGA